jgi:hypothetical protein
MLEAVGTIKIREAVPPASRTTWLNIPSSINSKVYISLSPTPLSSFPPMGIKTPLASEFNII